jgi:hypothetical protein
MKVVMTRHYLLTIHRCQSKTSSLCVWEENGELDVDDGQRRGDRYGMETGRVYCNGVNLNEYTEIGDKLIQIIDKFKREYSRV